MTRFFRRLLCCCMGRHREAIVTSSFSWYASTAPFGEIEFETWHSLHWRCVDCRRRVFIGHSRESLP